LLDADALAELGDRLADLDLALRLLGGGLGLAGLTEQLAHPRLLVLGEIAAGLVDRVGDVAGRLEVDLHRLDVLVVLEHGWSPHRVNASPSSSARAVRRRSEEATPVSAGSTVSGAGAAFSAAWASGASAGSSGAAFFSTSLAAAAVSPSPLASALTEASSSEACRAISATRSSFCFDSTRPALAGVSVVFSCAGSAASGAAGAAVWTFT